MKDAYYFSHDSNARNDQRLMKLRMKYGPEGYGIYFMIIEILRDTEDYKLHISDVQSICFDIRDDEEKVLDVLKNYSLFEFEGDYFHSKSLTRRMDKLDRIKEKRRESGKKGAIATAKVRQVLKTETASDVAIAEQVKHSKVENSKEDKITNKTGKFKKQVLEFQSKYDIEMLEEFILYWTEPNKSNTKIKWEMEATWHMGRRLARWANSNYQANRSPADKYKQNGKLDEEITNRNKNLAEQSKRFKRYMEGAKETAASPSEIGQIIGQTIEKLKPSISKEESDGQ
jgi:hypothetical protein